MIAKTNPYITAAAVAAVVGLSMFAPHRQTTAAGRLSGVLYSIDADTRAVQAAAAAMPEVEIGLDPATRAALPPASALIVRFVGIDESTFTLTLSRRMGASSLTAGTSKATGTLPSSSVKRKHKRAKTQAASVAIAEPAAPPGTAPAPDPPSPPKPTFPPAFTQIDDALRASSTVQAINVRVKKGGVAFRLTHVGRVGDRYVIRYAIANDDPDAFFLSIVNVSADGKPIQSETAGPYSCPTGQEIYGIVHFLPAAVAGKEVVVELVQSGGDHRRFSLPANYAF